jgi:aminoglycoside 3-N-acetyltransferase
MPATRESPLRLYQYYTVEGGCRVLKDFMAVDLDDSDFGRLGAALDVEPFVRCALVGNGWSRAVRLRDAVYFAEGWLAENRSG